MKNILLLSGWKGSGKDSLASILCNKFGYKRIAFADKLKDAISRDYNIDRSIFDDRVKKEMPLVEFPVSIKDTSCLNIIQTIKNELRMKTGDPPNGDTELSELFWTPRSLCILEGTVKRSIDPNFWTKSVKRELFPEYDYVISDCRYRSEIEFFKSEVRSHKITTIRINRDSCVNTEDSSERDLDDTNFDYIVSNDKSIEFLKTEAKRIISLI